MKISSRQPTAASGAASTSVDADGVAAAIDNPRRTGGWMRFVGFRVVAVVMAFGLFFVLDGVLGVVLPARVFRTPDAFVEFRSVRPLFVANAETGNYETAKDRLAYFRPDSFALEKSPNEFRIFCLGGSTVQGRPFAIETSFTTWLELALGAADSRREWEVVNCGGVSYASYRLVPILDEVLNYEPDLVVLYTGHNEFLEDRTYGGVRDAPNAVAWMHAVARRFNTYDAVRYWFHGAATDEMNDAEETIDGATDRTAGAANDDQDVMPTEVSARLDFAGGLDAYQRDPEWRQRIVQHFRHGVERMIDRCERAGVPLLLVNPGMNLRDCIPFKCQHRDGLSDAELAEWRRLMNEASEMLSSDPRNALTLLRGAEAIDDLHAGVHYQLGRCYDALLMREKAEASFRQAVELDVCPLRMIQPLHDELLEAAATTDTRLVDAEALFVKWSADGIMGGDLFVDHVHPSIHGHQKLATAMARRLIAMGYAEEGEGWDERREAAYADHYASLETFYFVKGMQRRENLRGWAAGRAKAVKE